MFSVNTFYENWPDPLLKSHGTPRCQRILHPRERHRQTSPVHLLDANACKGKVSFYFPSRSCFPGGTPCRWPTPSSGHRKPLPASRRESRDGRASRGFWKVPVIARPVPCWRKKAGGSVNLAWPAVPRWQRAFSWWSPSRLGRVGGAAACQSKWRWKCASLWAQVESQSLGDDQWLWRSEVLQMCWCNCQRSQSYCLTHTLCPFFKNQALEFINTKERFCDVF